MKKLFVVLLLVALLAADANCQQKVHTVQQRIIQQFHWIQFHCILNDVSFYPKIQKRKRVRHEKRKETTINPLLEQPELADEAETDVFQLLEKDEAAENARAELEAKLKALEEAEGIEQNEIDNMEDPLDGKL